MITLVLGGVRSGKSEVAERLAGPGPVTYVATGIVADDDFAERVARHRARRSPAWSTLEEPRAVPGLLRRLHGTVVLDALGTWVANDLRPDVDGLVAALTARAGDTVVVSEEVGLGVHPGTELGRRFADVLGEVNRRVAEAADRCLLVVAGRIVELPPGGVATRAAASATHAAPAPRTGAEPAAGDLPVVYAGRFRTALAFLTPLGRAATPQPGALVWFPVVGAVIGLLLGGWWWLADVLFGPLAGAALVVAADLLITGAIHFDGLVDSGDGLLAHTGGLSREESAEWRLAIMAEPEVGAFGIATGVTMLLLRTAALASMGGAHPLLLGALWTASRTTMATALRAGTYARGNGGLASAFLGPGPGSALVLGVAGIALAIVLAVADGPVSPAAVVVAVCAAGLVHDLARRRIGGYTGDVLGAAGVVGETAGLLVATAAAL